MINLYYGRYSVELCQRYPHIHFVFGDNLMRVGKGGQAIIRDEPNAIGLATKRAPGNNVQDYFVEGNTEHMRQIITEMERIEKKVSSGEIAFLILPVLGRDNHNSSLGCGLAALDTKCPALYGLINAWQSRMLRKYSDGFVTA